MFEYYKYYLEYYEQYYPNAQWLDAIKNTLATYLDNQITANIWTFFQACINEIQFFERDGSVLVYRPSIDLYSINPNNFNIEYYLVEKRDLAGNAIVYNRDTNGKVQTITDACENDTIIDWQWDFIKTITDPEGNTVVFDYSSGIIDSITDAAGFETEFDYGSSYMYFNIENKGRTEFQSYSSGRGDYIENTIEITDPADNVEIYQWAPAAYRTRNRNNFWHRYDRYYGQEFLDKDSGKTFSADSIILDYWLYSDETVPNYIDNEDFKLNNIKMFFANEKDSDGNVVDANIDILLLTLKDQPEVGGVFKMADTNEFGQFEISDALAEKTELTEKGDLFQIIDPANNSKITEFSYNNNGQVTSAKLPDGATWIYQYNNLGKLGKLIAPNGNWLRRYSYDDKGRIIKTEALIKPGVENNHVQITPSNLRASAPSLNVALIESEIIECLENSKILNEQNISILTAPNLMKSNLAKSKLQPPTLPNPLSKPNNLTRFIDHKWYELPVYAEIATLYNVTYSTNGAWQEITYNGNGKVITEFDKCGRAKKIIRSAIDETSYTTEYEHDGLGRITKVSYPDGSSTTVDMGLKGPNKITDRDNKTTEYVYNDIFQKEQIIRNDGGIINFEYSGLRLIGITDAKDKTTSFDYNGGRFTGQNYPGCKKQAVAYDWLTRVVATTNESDQITTYDYDDAGKLFYKNVNDGESEVDYSYNTNGKLETITDSVGQHIYSYNSRGKLLKDVFIANGNAALSYVLSYTYDNLGNRKTMTVAPEGETPHTIKYEYDENSLVLKSVTDNAISPGKKTAQYSFDNFGRLKSTFYANGANQKYNYNSDMRLETLNIKNSFGNELESYSYNYSPGGIIQSITVADANIENYDYDELNQITEEETKHKDNIPRTSTQNYDLNGNRISEIHDSVNKHNYEYSDDNRLISYFNNNRQQGFEYDARGNRTECNTSGLLVNYTYDAENRMTECSTSVSLVNYTYDSFGRKVKKVDNSQKVAYYIYDGMDCVFEKTKFDPPNDWETQWIIRGLGIAPGGGNIVAIKTYRHEDYGQFIMNDIKTDYYHPNHRGDTVFTTDENGEKKAELKYDTFGKTVYENNAVDVKYRFSSKEWDSAAQLYYYGFRWYDPEHGIWTTKDPIGFAAGDLNVYRMVANNPVLYADIYGKKWTNTGPNREPHAMGRSGMPVFNPDNSVMNLIEDYGPGVHDFAKIHDATVDTLTGMGVPDLYANIPTMLPAYGLANLLNVIESIFNAINKLTCGKGYSPKVSPQYPAPPSGYPGGYLPEGPQYPVY